MNPDLNAMALFVRVVQFKSFSEASKRLGVPISTVSRKVSELEKFLGIRLLERSTRKLRLTELGEEYYLYCARGLEEFDKGALVINDRQAEISGTLRLSIPPSLSETLIAPVLCDYQNLYPNIIIKTLVTERYVDLIEDGVDIALRVGKLNDSSMIAKPMLVYRHLLVATPEYLKSHNHLVHPNDLKQHRLITFGGWHEQVMCTLNNKSCSVNIAINSSLSINEMSGVLYAAEIGHGIADLPAPLCNKAIKKGKLIEVLPDWQFAPTTLWAVCPSKRHTLRMISLFMEFCREKFRKQNVYTGI